MCGIVGILAPRAPKNVVEEVFNNLLWFTEHRGADATGVALVPSAGGSVVTHRAPIRAREYIYLPEYKEVLNQYDGGAIIGHCRKTTRGSQSNNLNNHPIVSPYAPLALIHNGTIRDADWRAVNEDGENPYMWGTYQSEVDTESILRLIETMQRIPREPDGRVDPEVVAATPKDQWTVNVDLNQAIVDAAYNITGEMSCALLDGEDPYRIRLWRTEGRPGEMAYVPEYEMIVFASEVGILERSLTEWESHIVLDYFHDSKNVFPKWLHQTTTKNKLTDVRWDGSTFKIEEHHMDPGAGNPAPEKTNIFTKVK